MFRVFAFASTIPKTCVRRLSLSPIKHEKSIAAEMKKKQIQFQLNEDIPVYIKRGSIDYIMYYATVGLVVFGVGTSMSSLYKLASKN